MHESAHPLSCAYTVIAIDFNKTLRQADREKREEGRFDTTAYLSVTDVRVFLAIQTFRLSTIFMSFMDAYCKKKCMSLNKNIFLYLYFQYFFLIHCFEAPSNSKAFAASCILYAFLDVFISGALFSGYAYGCSFLWKRTPENEENKERFGYLQNSSRKG